ncbi:MAG: helix-turn-helix domain-containing protein [Parcubacteria group bacterium]|jgi:sugar-specific transcriptional regulator TrmB
MDNVKIIKDLGMPDQEAEAYIALLKLGGGLASAVAREMGIKRTTVYAILQSLARKNLVLVYFRKSRKYYHPVPPQKLASIFEKKLDIFKKIVPSLSSIKRKQAQMFGLRFIETKEELKQFYLDINNEYKNLKKKTYDVISSDISWESLDPEFFRQYRKDRAKLGIRPRLLFSEDSRKNVNLTTNLLREYKFLPKTYSLKSSINIFRDKVLIVDTKLDSLAVVILIQTMVDTFKAVFETLWQLLPEEKK